MCRSVIDNTRSAKLDISVQNHKSELVSNIKSQTLVSEINNLVKSSI